MAGKFLKTVGISKLPRKFQPKNEVDLTIRNWPVSTVLKWLAHNDLAKYIPVFQINDIDGYLLLRIDEDVLQNDFDLKKNEHYDKLVKVIQSVQKDNFTRKIGKSERTKESKQALRFSWGETVQIGTKIDCKDCIGNWSKAIVISINSERGEIMVNYLSSHSKWDEWISVFSDRFTPFLEKTEQTPLNSFKEAVARENEEMVATKEILSKLRSNNLSSLTYFSAYTPKSIKHAVSDDELFRLLKCFIKARGTVSAEMLEELGIGRYRAEKCYQDFLAKYVNGETMEPPSIEENIVKQKPPIFVEKKRKRSRRTTAMLTEDWREGNRKGLWKCPKCQVVLTAQKRYTHPCFRDNMLTIEQYNQSLSENQYRSEYLSRFH
ncbi:PHD finger protein 20 [Bonamia ostreae]|uniref:PHD finger protein 20 n=1 Tax=Bonamia ostreae TaxID=126728 RepID=A0ABV2ALI7_9EUKA